MSKTAILFAGQGAQKPGMGESLYQTSAAAKDIFDRAEAIMPGIKELCFAGTQEELNQTCNTQPCVYTVDMAAYAAVQDAVCMDAAAGFSLGEYAALTASGVLSFEETLKLVIKRAAWMQHCAEQTGGGMAAVLGKTAGEVETMLDGLREDGILRAVNYNCPGQTVIAADEKNFARFLKYAKENKVKAIPLAVSGAFHSEAMDEASGHILEYITNLEFASPQCTLYANALGEPYTDVLLKRTLAAQTAKPVYFEKIVRHMLATGVETFIEVGPGNTLSGFVKRTDKTAAVYNVSDAQTLETTLAALNKGE